MGPGIFILLAALKLMTVLDINQLNFADGAVPNHRQMLPPVPGYIPVYIQYGELPPDPNDFWIFQTASKILRPQVSPARQNPSTTTDVTGQSVPLSAISITPAYNANNGELPASSGGKSDRSTSPKRIPEESNICASSGNKIAEK